MIFKYGSYLHDQDEVMLRTSKTAIPDKFSRRMGEVGEYTVFGVCQVPYDEDPAVMQAALTAKLILLRTAYESDYQDFGLYLDDGTTPTEHVVLNSSTFGGVKVVVPPSYINGPWTGRIEYLNRRTYFLVIRAETRIGSGLYDYNERILIRGTGGEKWVYSAQEFGYPQRQSLQQLTTFQYIQEGSNVGRQDWVPPNEPLYPLIEHQELRVRVFETARDVTPQGNEMYGAGWRYVMESIATQNFNAFNMPTVGGF